MTELDKLLEDWVQVDEGYFIHKDMHKFSISDNANVGILPENRENNYTLFFNEKELITSNLKQVIKHFNQL